MLGQCHPQPSPHSATPHPTLHPRIPVYWGTPVYGDVSPYIGVSQPHILGVSLYMGMHSHIFGCPTIWGCTPIYWGTLGVSQYMRMHPHILGCPIICACIPKYWGTLAHGDASPYTGVSQYMRMHPHIFGFPTIWGCIPIYLGAPLYEDAFPNIGVP
jgi:hypothetical protein